MISGVVSLDSLLAFHAVPPEGQWINDPNGLFYDDGQYRLFAQHSSGLADRRIGWCRWSSPNLIKWTFDGVVIPAENEQWMYSGSVVVSDDWIDAIHTVHVNGLEHQVHRKSIDKGKRWSRPDPIPSVGEPTRNRRDPFVFRDGARWGMLLAEPCDWTTWRDEPASRLRFYRSDDCQVWRECGTIGPWRPPGILWEVPILVRFAGHDVLFVSEVDRRRDETNCSVKAWIGTLSDDGFKLNRGTPLDGQLLDFGPDFYALIPSSNRRRNDEQIFVAWASNWASARTREWPGFHGGPISLPRSIGTDLAGGTVRLTMHPYPGLTELFQVAAEEQPAAGLGRLSWSGDRLHIHARSSSSYAQLTLDRPLGQITLTRYGPRSEWSGGGSTVFSTQSELLIFVDGPLIELFVDGACATLALDWDGEKLSIEATDDGHRVAFAWARLA